MCQLNSAKKKKMQGLGGGAAQGRPRHCVDMSVPMVNVILAFHNEC